MTTVRLRPDVLHVPHGDRHLLLDQRDGGYYALNPTAAVLIHQLTAGTHPAHLADALVNHYPITPEQARGDVAALLADLRRNGLISGQAGEHGR